MNQNIILCSATLVAEENFFEHTLLGQSLKLIMPAFPNLKVRLTHGASEGLHAPYNAAIDAAGEDDLIVFVHDDVCFDDWGFLHHLPSAFEQFDVVGVCGNRSRDPMQQTWWGGDINDPTTIFGADRRSGQIRHAQQNHASILDFGPTLQTVKLLDGVFIAARASTLKASGVRFDPQFKYHFYDLDFSRQCEQAGLHMGTWPIAMLHGSSGGYGQTWHDGLKTYFDKWGD